ncbi:CoA pyrophosphatase [Motilimonas sp. KMU-193]|uniref:CoA pyrophosphatase n=1 Tax=Motilimonas sp. KMU-193 TaxID=3388668 RepID=UPI00396B06DD
MLHRFILHPPKQIANYASTGRAASVLVGLQYHQQQWHVLLTQRAFHLRHHRGQIAFPGGKVEQTDRDLIHTALRESHEEVGLESQFVNVIGALPQFHTGTGFSITPIVAKLTSGYRLQIDNNEVHDVFLMPLKQIKRRHYWQTNIRGKQLNLVFIPYRNRLIWGATAAILDNLYQQLY